MRPGHHPNSRKNLKPIKPGEVRNPTGKNQWSTLRSKALACMTDNFDALVAKALELALDGDTSMLKFLLGAGFDIKSLQILDDSGAAQSFAELAKMARTEKADTTKDQHTDE